MNRKILSTLIAIVVVLSALVISCQKENKKEVDIVNDIEPMNRLDTTRQDVLNQLSSIPDDEKIAYLQEHWPNLANDVILSIRGQYIPANTIIDSVVFMFGSGRGTANDKNMDRYEGKFKDQLIAAIYIRGDKNNPHLYFVQCTNGLFNPHPADSDVRRLGSFGNMEFTINPGQGLCHHLDYRTSILLAQAFGLQVYRGQAQKSVHQITYDEALSLESETDRVQVTVRVYAGDQFNLGTMTSNHYARVR